MPIGRLHVITDPTPGQDVLARVGEVLAAGAPVIQVRAKDLTDREFYELTCRVQDLCAQRDAMCIVDDRVHVAQAAGADGVHVGADDLPVGATRGLLGPEPVVGATARDPATALSCARDGATYLGVGPCFATETKRGLPDPLPFDTLSEIVDSVSIPVIAIAGITPARVPTLLEAGVHGVAVVGAVWHADDPCRAVEELLHALGGPR